MTSNTCRWLVAATLPLVLGLGAESIGCSVADACLGVALEFQPEGQQRATAADQLTRALIVYGAALWLGFGIAAWTRLGWSRGRGSGRRRLFGTAGLGILGGLVLVYVLTVSRWGVEVPTPTGSGPGDNGGSSADGESGTTHFILEWPGPDHIPDALEWWAMALLPWALALLIGYAMARRSEPLDKPTRND
ncbi:MAG: hypothetical protein ABEL51_06560 [Salinibacter sp.]